MDMSISFPGGKKVNATYNGFTIKTDPSVKDGGDGSAPEPFSLFLASMGTCAGVFVLYFCEERGIDTTGLKMNLTFNQDEQTYLLKKVKIKILLPPNFPPKYKTAVIKSAKQCTVKRNITTPPEFVITADIQQ
ncbi:MAG: osmotically inducible protein OsmC [Deltaproteobacteria bacterium]|nr:osmotically inducible protein OsmC [Deltaproteobacteria bacterium]